MNFGRAFLNCAITMIIVGGVGLLLMNPNLEGAALVEKLNSIFFITGGASLISAVVGLFSK